MYNFLTEAVKRRFIYELRRFWAYHPKYPALADSIQGKYAFRERPQQGIILKTSSANHVQLSADNFQGTINSYVQLVKYQDKPGLAIEWVREDAAAIRANGGVFPSAPGIYYVTIVETSGDVNPYDASTTYDFEVDPLLEVQDEVATKVDDFTWAVGNSYLAQTTAVFEMPGSIPYVRGVNYTEDPTTGQLSVTTPLSEGRYLLVSYRYPAPTTGPFRITENFSNRAAIPGCVLAFGRRIQAGDIMAVVVYDRRQPTALEYGGRWDISLDFDVMARDVGAQQEIADATVMYLWGIARNRLSSEGIEITAVSMGGESEEVYDETGDDYYYNASFSVQTQTDWSIHVPLTATIRRVVPLTQEQVNQAAGLTDEELLESGVSSNIQVLESLGLRTFDDPFFDGRTFTFEKIK
jgi:hypothetical protein